MRIVWSEQENYFQAEIPPGENWRDDMELVRSVGFRTSGPPMWPWFTTKYAPLEKLRDQKPKSGLTITELALQKYKFLKEQADQKDAIKDQFKKAVRDAEERAPSKWPQYKDPETGITCFVVEPTDESFVWKYIPPPPPNKLCLGCDGPMYFPFDDRAYCMYCEIGFEKKVENKGII